VLFWLDVIILSIFGKKWGIQTALKLCAAGGKLGRKALEFS
jgi:hypothetical protein